ncbi:MAG: hypothetical protein ACFFC3_11785, partial [Candidatus Odinarchaeota archaeon]
MTKKNYRNAFWLSFIILGLSIFGTIGFVVQLPSEVDDSIRNVRSSDTYDIQVSPEVIFGAQEITLSWDPVAKPQDGSIRYLDYDFSIYMKYDSAGTGWELIASIDLPNLDARIDTILIDPNTPGTYSFKIEEWSRKFYIPRWGSFEENNHVKTFYSNPVTYSWPYNFEDCNLGTYSDPSWELIYGAGSSITIENGQDFGMPEQGKMLRIFSPNPYSGVEMNKQRPLSDTNDAIVFSFKGFLDSTSEDCEIKFKLLNDASNRFFEIDIESDPYLGGKIIVKTPHEQVVIDKEVNHQLFDFLIIFFRDPNTNLLLFSVFINQKLEFCQEEDVSIDVDFLQITFQDNLDEGAEFFIDDFFLGYLDNLNLEISDAIEKIVPIPLYYLYVPEKDPSVPHNLNMFYRLDIEEESITKV